MLIGFDSLKSERNAAVMSLVVWPVWPIVWRGQDAVVRPFKQKISCAYWAVTHIKKPQHSPNNKRPINYFLILSAVCCWSVCRFCSCWHRQLHHREVDWLQQLEMPESRHRNTHPGQQQDSRVAFWLQRAAVLYFNSRASMKLCKLRDSPTPNIQTEKKNVNIKHR